MKGEPLMHLLPIERERTRKFQLRWTENIFFSLFSLCVTEYYRLHYQFEMFMLEIMKVSTLSPNKSTVVLINIHRNHNNEEPGKLFGYQMK